MRRRDSLGIATTRHGHGVPTRRIKVIEAGHPVPDEAGLKGAEESLRLAAGVVADDLLLVLLSGGGSANWIAPVEGVSFAQKQQVTRALLRSGAPIGEVNTVRKHLSRIKGGRLARAGHRAEIVTLAISDVPHDDPSAIAWGPTVPDPTTLSDARAIVAKYDLDVGDAVRRALDDARNESCKPGDPAFARAQFELIARPKTSLDAAIKIAKDAGYDIIDLGADLEGEARDVAADHAQLALRARSQGKRIAILSGGELTVRGSGRGGGPIRNMRWRWPAFSRIRRAYQRLRRTPTARTAAPAARPIPPGLSSIEIPLRRCDRSASTRKPIWITTTPRPSLPRPATSCSRVRR